MNKHLKRFLYISLGFLLLTRYSVSDPSYGNYHRR